jgi:hypothetical protein
MKKGYLDNSAIESHLRTNTKKFHSSNLKDLIKIQSDEDGIASVLYVYLRFY